MCIGYHVAEVIGRIIFASVGVLILVMFHNQFICHRNEKKRSTLNEEVAKK